MKVSLLTDAPKHNLALMKVSAYHKANGDKVILNTPLQSGIDLSYGSWLFSQQYSTDFVGGPAIDPSKILCPEVESMRPDYDLFQTDYSLGFTWRYCPRKCEFCVVPKQPKVKHHDSIWSFHDNRFSKICLLNNNTFSDPKWLETFEEIWEAKLTVHDENGYDLRLLDEQKAETLKKTKFDGRIHFAWDFIEDEATIVRGLELVKKFKLRAACYVLIGFPDYRPIDDTDIYRCQKIWDHGVDIYPMPFNGGNKQLRQFKRFIRLFAYKNYRTIAEGWQLYDPAKRRGRNHG